MKTRLDVVISRRERESANAGEKQLVEWPHTEIRRRASPLIAHCPRSRKRKTSSEPPKIGYEHGFAVCQKEKKTIIALCERIFRAPLKLQRIVFGRDPEIGSVIE